MRKLIGTLVVVLFASAALGADDYPARAVRVVVPFAPGGGTDLVARILGQRLSQKLGQSFVIENRPAGSGIVGADLVAKAPADGYTLLFAFSSLSSSAKLFSHLPYDPIRDFAPVALATTSPLLAVVPASLPAKNVGEFIAYAKANPGKLNYGSSGIGSIHHLATEALKAGFGIDLVHVPYKGTGQSVPALLGGQVALLYSALPSIAGHLKDGKVKMLAISSVKRSPHTPDVPTVAENGIAGYDYVAEIGLLAPAATPREVIQRLASEMAKVLKQPDIVKRFTELGIDAVGSSPTDYAALNKTEYEKYGKLVKETGAKVD